MSWAYLIAAILLEVSGTTSMKLSEGFSKKLPSVMIFIFYGFSFVCLTFALKKIEVSVAYAIWSGLGTAVTCAIGIFWLRESFTPIKAISILLIVTGVVGLHLGNKILN